MAAAIDIDQKLADDYEISTLFSQLHTPVNDYDTVYCQQDRPANVGKQPATAMRRRKKKKEKEGMTKKKKRKLSDEQARLLELNFENEHKLESERKDRLAAELDLDPRQVAVWFQNRRASWKNKKLQHDYSILKSSHDHVLLEKCRLQAEVFKLNEQLSEAEKEIQRLLDSPSCSRTTEAIIDGPKSSFGGVFDVVYEDLVYYNMTQPAYFVNGVEWVYI